VWERKKTISIAIAAAVLAGVYIFTVTAAKQVPPIDDAGAYRAYWSEYAKRHGSAAAYEAFKNENATAPEEDRHRAAHVIGDVLYERESVRGIAICDQSFGFGCFHGLFSAAFAEERADELVRRLDDACLERFGVGGTGCQHGIGHGILEYLGYERLHDALALCDETARISPFLGCVSGVFMEYSNPLVSDPAANTFETRPRPFDAAAPYGPCGAVPEPYRLSCYFELAPWWSAHMTGKYGEMGAFCAKLPREEDRRACTIGIGSHIAVKKEFDIENAGRACDALGGTTRRVWCRAGAAWAVHAESKADEARAPELCTPLSTKEREECLSLYRLDAAALN